MKFSDEVECGYTLWKHKDGGNFDGVCRGLDQAVSSKNTYPKSFHAVWDFILVKYKTPGCIITCQAN